MKLSALLGWIGGVSLFGGVLLCSFPYGYPKWLAKRSACLSTTKQQAIAFLIYTSDFDDRYPQRDHWMDALRSYTKESEWTYWCPETPKGACGYAFNASLSFAKTPKDAETVPLVYESVAGIRNASDLFISLPRPGRHRGKDSVAFADGHAKSIVVK